ncbi:unnamed protein product [Heligmosomoides polygyrus]|uniref:Endo/exonuclease/phosphatase domain-containing protein n=1 Tax=Heligmosomoides polygyrus TaxID=6339 RepID=A0A183FLF5_HELPZ|nr:unnamed protein product [Heligmosomoides polygyrus]
MTICTYNARTLASEASIEELMMQGRKIKYDVIGLTETRRHQFVHAASKTALLYKREDVHDIGNYPPIRLLSVVYSCSLESS